jgi:hypothetical protein
VHHKIPLRAQKVVAAVQRRSLMARAAQMCSLPLQVVVQCRSLMVAEAQTHKLPLRVVVAPWLAQREAFARRRALG